jgi:hypothetical protein
LRTREAKFKREPSVKFAVRNLGDTMILVFLREGEITSDGIENTSEKRDDAENDTGEFLLTFEHRGTTDAEKANKGGKNDDG